MELNISILFRYIKFIEEDAYFYEYLYGVIVDKKKLDYFAR